ncbi:MAG: hypothetical protein MUF49_02470 [Oculatellaceae cyanobacterium Prado106]|jgi:hypothetical protein|nr:hypothetical protein [Oculatellaceae cyanobacterium Prado106]
MNDSERANLLELIAFQQRVADDTLNRYKIRPDLTLEELAQVVMYLSDRLKEEQRQRRLLETQLMELQHRVQALR